MHRSRMAPPARGAGASAALRRSRALARVALALALPLLAATGCDDKASGGQAQAAPPPPPVTVAAPLVQRITEWDEYTGRFESVQQVDLRARVSGYVQEIGFQDGQTVEAGQMLFVIDPRPYQAALDQTSAQVEQAKAQLTLAELDQSRTAQLVSQSNAAKAQLDQRNAELLSAKATLASNQAQMRNAQLNLGFTRITAPFAGRISNRRVDRGNLVDASTLLTTIVQLDPVYMTFDMSEQDFLGYQRAVAAGRLPSTRDNETPVELHLIDEDGWPHQGTMNFVDNVVSRSTGTIRGRAVVPNADRLITPGQFGRIRVPGSLAYDAILIPDSAVVTDQSRKLVMTLGQDNVVTARPVRLGPSQPGGLRIVRDGLKPEDKLVIDGLIRARPGAKVTPKDGKVEPVPGMTTASAAS